MLLIFLPNLGMGASGEAPAVSGPYRVDRAEVHMPGAVASEVRLPGGIAQVRPNVGGIGQVQT